MEPLHRRSDGACETPSGLFAIVPRVKSGSRNGVDWFEYKTTVFSTPVRIEWETGAALVLVEQPVAINMVRNGWADGISDDLLAKYMEVYADVTAKAPKAPSAPTPPKLPEPVLPPPPPPEAPAPAPVATEQPLANAAPAGDTPPVALVPPGFAAPTKKAK